MVLRRAGDGADGLRRLIVVLGAAALVAGLMTPAVAYPRAGGTEQVPAALPKVDAAEQPCLHALPCGERWRATYDGPGSGKGDAARYAGTSPSGDTVYVTGDVWIGEAEDLPFAVSPVLTREKYAIGTIAYDAETGEELWAALYSAPSGDLDRAYGLAVDPTGERVFVTGASYASVLNSALVTVAYDAETGEQLWAVPYRGRHQSNVPVAVDVDPAGRRVFVSGWSFSPFHIITVGYDAETGEELWVQETAGDQAAGEDLVVDPSGERVYITAWEISSVAGPGHPFPGAGIPSYRTTAYDAATGEELWTSYYHGYPGVSARPTYVGGGLDVAPDGERLFVTGTAWRATGSGDREMHTIAYDTATGEELWVGVVEHPPAEHPRGEHYQWRPNLVVGPDSGRVFVTFRMAMGAIEDHRHWTSDNYMRAVAYDAATGEELWLTRYDGTSTPQTPVVSPDGGTLYVIGDNLVVAAFDTGSGGLRWEYGARPTVRLPEDRHGGAVAARPDGSAVFATGSTAGEHLGGYLTVALDASGPRQD